MGGAGPTDSLSAVLGSRPKGTHSQLQNTHHVGFLSDPIHGSSPFSTWKVAVPTSWNGLIRPLKRRRVAEQARELRALCIAKMVFRSQSARGRLVWIMQTFNWGKRLVGRWEETVYKQRHVCFYNLLFLVQTFLVGLTSLKLHFCTL